MNDKENIIKYIKQDAKGIRLCKNNVNYFMISEFFVLFLFFIVSSQLQESFQRQVGYSLSFSNLFFIIFQYTFCKLFNPKNKILAEAVYNAVAYSIATIGLCYALVFVEILVQKSIYTFLINFLIFILFTIVNMSIMIKRMNNGYYLECIKGIKKRKENILLIFIPLLAILGIVIGKITVKNVSVNTSGIIMEILILILLCLLSFGYINILKIYYIKKFNIK